MTYTFSKKSVDENVNAMVLFGEATTHNGAHCITSGLCGDITVE